MTSTFGKAITESANERTLKYLLIPIPMNPEWNSMTSDFEKMEYGLLSPFGKQTFEKIPIKVKAEVKALRTCDMDIHDVDTIKMNWWRMGHLFSLRTKH